MPFIWECAHFTLCICRSAVFCLFVCLDYHIFQVETPKKRWNFLIMARWITQSHYLLAAYSNLEIVCVCVCFGCVTESKITDSLAHNWIACGRAITFNRIMTERLIANSSWQTWCVNHLFGLFSVNSLIFFTITVFLSESRSGKVCQTQEKGVSVPKYWVFCLMLKGPGINNIA